MSAVSPTPHSGMQRFLDVVERVGNKVPHPTVIFLIMIAIVIVLSYLFYLLGVTVDYQVVNPQTHEIESATASVRSLLVVWTVLLVVWYVFGIPFGPG